MLLAGLVGVTRVYLGVHYPTDVLAGWLVGLSWALLCWLVERAIERPAWRRTAGVEQSGPEARRASSPSLRHS